MVPETEGQPLRTPSMLHGGAWERDSLDTSSRNSPTERSIWAFHLGDAIENCAPFKGFRFLALACLLLAAVY